MSAYTEHVCPYPCRFVCEGTVEDKISILQEKKKDLAQKVLSGTGASFTKLSLADLRVIFGVWRPGSKGGGGSQTEDQVVAGAAILKLLVLCMNLVDNPLCSCWLLRTTVHIGT